MYQYYTPEPGYWEARYAEEAASAAADKARRIAHAASVLEKTPVGERVVFEGSCPSGSTYSGAMVWDGTESQRQKILALATGKYAGWHAWAAWLRREEDVRGDMAAAEMRTGRT